MISRILAVIATVILLAAPCGDAFARGGGHGSHKSSSSGTYSSSGGSHHVKGYYRKDGTYVRPHMSGNPKSGNHWHLNKDGSDTLTRRDGSKTTIPLVK